MSVGAPYLSVAPGGGVPNLPAESCVIPGTEPGPPSIGPALAPGPAVLGCESELNPTEGWLPSLTNGRPGGTSERRLRQPETVRSAARPQPARVNLSRSIGESPRSLENDALRNRVPSQGDRVATSCRGVVMFHRTRCLTKWLTETGRRQGKDTSLGASGSYRNLSIGQAHHNGPASRGPVAEWRPQSPRVALVSGGRSGPASAFTWLWPRRTGARSLPS